MKKPTKNIVFDEVLSVLREIQEWLQFPEDDNQMDPVGRQFYQDWLTLKSAIIKKYLDKL